MVRVSQPQAWHHLAALPRGLTYVGVLDSIGYFPQMIIVSLSTIGLLLILVVHEFDAMRNRSHGYGPMGPVQEIMIPSTPPRRASIAPRLPRPPSSPTANSTSMEIAQWEMRRLMKQLRGDYVFPPVKSSHRLMPSETPKASHRRVKTMSKIMEAGEVSHWSDSE